MQRLMGRRAKTLLPITTNLRNPEIQNPGTVTSKLKEHKLQQKYYYDQKTKPQDNIQTGYAVRIHTPEGWKPAEYVKPASTYPRSYIVKAGNSGREYRRNREMLMKTKEEPHIIMQKKNIQTNIYAYYTN